MRQAGSVAHEHLPTSAVLFALRLLAPVMSADGSWVFALMNIYQTAVLFALRLLQRQSCRQMVHGVFALMNI
jgi:hypothetical protein